MLLGRAERRLSVSKLQVKMSVVLGSVHAPQMVGRMCVRASVCHQDRTTVMPPSLKASSCNRAQATTVLAPAVDRPLLRCSVSSTSSQVIRELVTNSSVI